MPMETNYDFFRFYKTEDNESFKQIINAFIDTEERLVNEFKSQLTSNITLMKTDSSVIHKHIENVYTLVPIIVNRAFLCELILKYLIDNQVPKGNIPKGRDGHKLGKLFTLLNDSQRNSINASIKDQLNIDETEFNTKLENVSNAFIEWRYIFESSGEISLSFLDSFTKTLKSVYLE